MELNKITFLVLATTLSVSCMYVDYDKGIEADTNGKPNKKFEDSLIHTMTYVRKKEEVDGRRKADIDPLPPAIKDSIKEIIAALRRPILRRSSQKVSDSSYTRAKRRIRGGGVSHKSPEPEERLMPALRTLNRFLQIETKKKPKSDDPDKKVKIERRVENDKDPIEELLKGYDKMDVVNDEEGDESGLTFDLEMDTENQLKYKIGTSKRPKLDKRDEKLIFDMPL